MAQLIVRKVDDDLVLALKQRAARHGRSAEAEHREILRDVLAPDARRQPFKEFLESMPEGLADEDLARSDELPREIEL
jgi:plasmid stability protein